MKKVTVTEVYQTTYSDIMMLAQMDDGNVVLVSADQPLPFDALYFEPGDQDPSGLTVEPFEIDEVQVQGMLIPILFG